MSSRNHTKIVFKSFELLNWSLEALSRCFFASLESAASFGRWPLNGPSSLDFQGTHLPPHRHHHHHHHRFKIRAMFPNSTSHISSESSLAAPTSCKLEAA